MGFAASVLESLQMGIPVVAAKTALPTGDGGRERRSRSIPQARLRSRALRRRKSQDRKSQDRTQARINLSALTTWDAWWTRWRAKLLPLTEPKLAHAASVPRG